MKEDASIYVVSSGDIIGERLLRTLRKRGCPNLLNDIAEQPDIRNRNSLNEFFQETLPQNVFLTAGKSGGIQANRERPADLMLDNLQIACDVIHASHTHGVERLLYLGSSCVYPRLAEQPMRPEMLMMGHLEPTNVAYATAKLAGIELCRAYSKQYGVCFSAAIPANVFGPGDDFSDTNSHVIGALIGKIHRAQESDSPTVEIWGSGTPRREFIFVDDLVDACLFVMGAYLGDSPINISTGQSVSILDLAKLVKDTLGYQGQLEFDSNRPDGMPEKLLDSTPLFNLGWRPKFELDAGIRLTYEWYRRQLSAGSPPE